MFPRRGLCFVASCCFFRFRATGLVCVSSFDRLSGVFWCGLFGFLFACLVSGFVLLAVVPSLFAFWVLCFWCLRTLFFLRVFLRLALQVGLGLFAFAFVCPCTGRAFCFLMRGYAVGFILAIDFFSAAVVLWLLRVVIFGQYP